MESEFERLIVDVSDKIVINPNVRSLCVCPYPDHPKGCPNFNKKETCPPKTSMIQFFVDFHQPILFLIVRFNLAQHIAKMKERHPDMTDRQAKCLLYWQPHVHVEQMKMERDFFTLRSYSDYRITYSPEAMGVDVFKTLKAYNILYEQNPINEVVKIALVGRTK